MHALRERSNTRSQGQTQERTKFQVAANGGRNQRNNFSPQHRHYSTHRTATAMEGDGRDTPPPTSDTTLHRGIKHGGHNLQRGNLGNSA